jgi:hypothetical protein
MAIGGYKFRGYHYPARTATAGSEAEKAIFLDWFKCRLAAFKASCEASGALWRLLPACADSGTYSGTAWSDEDACIHVLDDTGCNFGTFFQYGNEDKYMAMVSSNVFSNALLARRAYRYASSTYHIDRSYDVISVGEEPITPDNINWSSIAGRLLFSGVQADWGDASVNKQRAVSNYSYGLRWGFATKGTDIIEFFNTASGTTNMYFMMISPDAFDSLCSPADQYKAAAVGASISFTTKSSAEISDPLLSYVPFGFLKNTGEQYLGGSTNSQGVKMLAMFAERMAYYWPTTTSMPFVSPLIGSAPGYTQAANLINNDGIANKGTIRADLMAVNTDLSQPEVSSVSPGAAYGGGNYLCVGGLSTTSSSYTQNQGAVYIGWDPSNPSILASTSWPDWPDAMPQALTPQAAPELDPVNVQ